MKQYWNLCGINRTWRKLKFYAIIYLKYSANNAEIDEERTGITMRASIKKTLIYSLILVALIAVFSVERSYAAEITNNLDVNKEYKISSLDRDYISGYSFYLHVPEKGRVKFIIEGCNDVYYDFLWIDNGDGSRSTRDWKVSGDRLDSGWISVTPGHKNMKLGSEQGHWAKNETLYVEFEPFTDGYGDVEDNDTLETANCVRLGEAIQGNYSGKSDEYIGDIDCYMVEIPSPGLMELSLINHDNPNYVIPFTFYSMDQNGNYEEVLSVENDSYLSLNPEQTPAKTNFKYRLPQGQYYFKLEIAGRESSEYELKINFFEESATTHEQEKNDSSRTANDKVRDTKYTANLNTKDDVDWYKFSLPAKGTVKLNFWTPGIVADGKLNITLYDKNLNEIVSKRTNASKYFSIDSNNLFSQTCYVRVKSIGDGLDSEYDYQLQAVFRCMAHEFNSEIIEKPDYGKKGKQISTCEVCQYVEKKTLPALKLKKVVQKAVKKSGASKVKVSWKTVKDKDGYQIYKMTKKKGGYAISQKYTTKKQYINLKVKKGKTYYYKVRAYKNTEKGKVYGSWSVIKKYTLKK